MPQVVITHRSVTDLVSKSHQSTNLMTSVYCKRFSLLSHMAMAQNMSKPTVPFCGWFPPITASHERKFLGSDMEAVVHGKGDTGL